jgi:hypothetical protein
MIVAVALAATIWGAVTGFYGTRHWRPVDVCKATYLSDRFAVVKATIHGTPHVAALHYLDRRTGWVVMWADGRVNRRIGPSTRPLVLAEVTRLKAKCLAP